MLDVVYIAHEYPARSQTFVVNEALGLEAHGARVRLFAINRRSLTPDARLTIWSWRSISKSQVLMELPGIAVVFVFKLPQILRLVAHRPFSLRSLARSGKAAGLAVIVAALIRSERMDNVHIRGHFFGLMSQVALIAAYLLSRTPHSTSIMGHAGDVANPASRSRLKSEVAAATFVTGASKFVTRLLDALDTTTPVHLLHCGVDIGQSIDFSPLSRPLTLVTVCRLVPKKGVDTLLHAVADAVHSGQDLTVEIVGDGQERQSLELLSRELKIVERVKFLGARQPQEIVGILRGSKGLFVLPSRLDASGDTDGIPVALMEAMGQGLPVISTRLGGIPELIEDGRTGFLVPPADVAALTRVIRSVYLSRVNAKAVAEAGQRAVAADFASQKIGKILFDLVASV